MNSEGGFAPLPTVVARLTARSSVPPPNVPCYSDILRSRPVRRARRTAARKRRWASVA
jgi:hypothetical protein